MFILVLSRRLFLAFRPVILCAFFLLTAEQAPLARTLLERNQLCEAQAQVFQYFEIFNLNQMNSDCTRMESPALRSFSGLVFRQ